MPEIIDSRGYQLVGKIPESDALARGLASMMQRRDRVNSEAKNRETMREAGILSGVYNIQDDAESNAYIDAMIARSTNDVERGELEQLKSYDLNTRRNIARQALTSKGLGAMIPGQDNGAGWQAYKGQDQQRQVGTDEDGQPIYQDFAVVTRTNARTGQIENIQEPLTGQYKQDGSPIIGMKAATAGAVSRATEQGRTGAIIESADTIKDIKAKEAGAIEQAKSDVQVKSAYEMALEQARAKAQQASMQAANETKFALDQTNPIFKMADEAIADKESGFYSGDYMSSFAGGFLPKAGIVLDQAKLNNTTKLRMALTQLKLGAKPVGSGNPTPGEWEMYAKTIPDPDTATTGQLIYAYNAYKKQVADKYKELDRAGVKGSSSQKETAQPNELDSLRKELGL